MAQRGDDDQLEDEEDAEVQRRLQERRNAQNEQMAALYENFLSVATPDQLERFEHWVRSKFPRAAMRRLMAELVGNSNERGAIVLSAIAKMFVGDLIETARENMTSMGEAGPITPSRLRRAHRQAQRTGTVPRSSRRTPRLFWRSDCGA